MLHKILVSLLYITVGIIYAQTTNSDVEKEIIALLSDSTIVFPNGKTTGTPSELNISSTELQNLFNNRNVEMVSQLVPNFKNEDRVKMSRSGDLITLSDWKNYIVVKLPGTEKRAEVMENLKNIPNVLHVEPNLTIEFDTVPDDDEFERQWNLYNEGTQIQGSGTSGADINALDAWDITTGESSINIAIVDDGIDMDHVEFDGRISGDSENGGIHGTKVAGVAAAEGNNDEGIAGVAWNVGIINEDIGNGSINDLVNAILSAINRDGHIINNSYGLVPLGTYSIALHAAFADAYKLNIANVASMGNEGDEVLQYPAGFRHGVTAVGATTNTDGLAEYSSTGEWIDIVAPGGEGSSAQDEKDNIYTTIVSDDYDYTSGTSFSAPTVSGLIGLMFSIDIPGIILDHDDADEIIKLTADKVAGMGENNFTEEYGYGRVNAGKALKYLLEPYEIKHRSTVGGSINSTSSEFVGYFYGDDGLIDGYPYIVKRHEVRKTVTFDEYPETNVWGRGYLTTGVSYWNPNYGMGFCEVVSFNSTSAILRTYIYEVWTESLDYLGFYPCTASNVYLNYTIHQKTSCLPPSNLTSTWYNNHPKLLWTASDDPELDYYEVWKQKDGNWSLKGTTSNTYYVDGSEIKFIGGEKKHIYYKIRASDDYSNKSTYTNSVHFVIDGEDQQQKLITLGDKTTNIPTSFVLKQNYPNPFNPETKIQFGLPEDSFVKLQIFNIQGQIVATLVDGSLEAGYHTATFDATTYPSGVYFYKIVAGDFMDIKRMLLVK